MNWLQQIPLHLALLAIFLAFIIGLCVGTALCAWATNMDLRSRLKKKEPDWKIYTKDGFFHRRSANGR